MPKKHLGAWFEDQRDALYLRFTQEASDALRFPGFSALKLRQRREVIRREVDGLISFMMSNNEKLEKATENHKDQNRRFLSSITIQEQIDFLQARTEIVKEMFLSDPETQDLQDDFRRKLDMAERFYRTQSRAIDLEQRFEQLS